MGTRRSTLDSELSLDIRLDLTGKVVRVGEHYKKAGGFSDVWEGLLGSEVVAVKVIREFQTSYEKLSRRLLRETQAWSVLEHRNVLPFYGYTKGFGRTLPSLVSPWMSNGTATEYLKDRSMSERLRVITQVADGLAYLHRHQVVHGDLKGSNVLMTAEGDPRLADFGLSKLVSEDVKGIPTYSIFGSVRWMAPELARGKDGCDFETDTWAYGMTLLEVLTCEIPYHYIRNDFGVLAALQNGVVPDYPQYIHDAYEDVRDLCHECWQEPADRRPSMRAVSRRMRHLENMYQRRGKRPSELFDADSDSTDIHSSFSSAVSHKSPRLQYASGSDHSGFSPGRRGRAVSIVLSESPPKFSATDQPSSPSLVRFLDSASDPDIRSQSYLTKSPHASSVPSSRTSPGILGNSSPREAARNSSGLGLSFGSPSSGIGSQSSGPSSPGTSRSNSSSSSQRRLSNSLTHTPSPLGQPVYFRDPMKSPRRGSQKDIRFSGSHQQDYEYIPEFPHAQRPALFPDFLSGPASLSPLPTAPSSPIRSSPRRPLELEDLFANDYLSGGSEFVIDASWNRSSLSPVARTALNEPPSIRPVDFTSLAPQAEFSPALSDIGITSTPVQHFHSFDDNLLDDMPALYHQDTFDCGDFDELALPEDESEGALFGGLDAYDDYGRSQEAVYNHALAATPTASPRRFDVAFKLHVATPSPKTSPRRLVS